MSFFIELPDLPIRVTARGDWLHGDELLHPKAAKLFQQHIFLADGGGYELRLGFNRAPLDVADTPYFVRSMALYSNDENDGLRKVDLVISDDSHEELDARTLMHSEDNVLYCRVIRHGVWVPCRFPPHHYHSLALHAEIGESGQGYLLLNGARHGLGPYNNNPIRSLD